MSEYLTRSTSVEINMAKESLLFVCERCHSPFNTNNPVKRFCTRSCASKSNSNQHTRIHGESEPPTPEYLAYVRARKRCNDKTDPYYGGKGIEFRFTTYSGFLAEVGRKPTPLHTLERKNVLGHYEPGNVCWATRQTQARNRTSNHYVAYKGQSLTVGEWSTLLGLSRHAVRMRLQTGWCIPCAVSLANGRRCAHK